MTPHQIRTEIFNWFLETYQDIAFSFRMNLVGLNDGQKAQQMGQFKLQATNELRARLREVFRHDKKHQYRALHNSLNTLADKLVRIFENFIVETTDERIEEIFIAITDQSNRRHYFAGGVTPVLKLLENFNLKAFEFTKTLKLGNSQNDEIAHSWKQITESVGGKKGRIEEYWTASTKDTLSLSLGAAIFLFFLFNILANLNLSNDTNARMSFNFLIHSLILLGIITLVKFVLYNRMQQPALSSEMLGKCHSNLTTAIDQHFEQNADKFIPSKPEPSHQYTKGTYSRSAEEKRPPVAEQMPLVQNEAQAQPTTILAISAQMTFDIIYNAESRKIPSQSTAATTTTQAQQPTFPNRNPHYKEQPRRNTQQADVKQTVQTEAEVYEQLTNQGSAHASWLVPLPPFGWIDTKAIPHAITQAGFSEDKELRHAFTNTAQRGKMLPADSKGEQGIKNYSDPVILFDTEGNAHLYRHELKRLGQYGDNRIFCRQVILTNGKKILIPDLYKESHGDAFPNVVMPYRGYKNYQQDYLAPQDGDRASMSASTPRLRVMVPRLE